MENTAKIHNVTYNDQTNFFTLEQANTIGYVQMSGVVGIAKGNNSTLILEGDNCIGIAEGEGCTIIVKGQNCRVKALKTAKFFTFVFNLTGQDGVVIRTRIAQESSKFSSGQYLKLDGDEIFSDRMFQGVEGIDF